MKALNAAMLATALAGLSMPVGRPQAGQGYSAMPSGLTAYRGENHRASAPKKAKRKAQRVARRQNRK